MSKLNWESANSKERVARQGSEPKKVIVSKADTKAAKKRKSAPTSKQIKQAEQDAKVRATKLKPKFDKTLTEMSSTDFLAATGKPIKPLKSERKFK